MPLPLPLQLQLQLRQVVSLWPTSCKWHQLRPLAFLRKHFANETDTSSVSCRTSCQLRVASCKLPVGSCRLPDRCSAAPGSVAVSRCGMPHLLHSKATYGGHKNVKRTTFATLPPFGHKEMEHARARGLCLERPTVKLDAHSKSCVISAGANDNLKCFQLI